MARRIAERPRRRKATEKSAGASETCPGTGNGRSIVGILERNSNPTPPIDEPIMIDLGFRSSFFFIYDEQWDNRSKNILVTKII